MTEHNATATATTLPPERDPGLDRLFFLTDGVYAIALTLLAVELALPETAEHRHGEALLQSLLDTWPKVLSFLTSFTAIAIFWQGHNRTFQHVRRFDGRLLWLQLLQLLCIAFIPFPTAVIGTHVQDPVAQEFYLGVLLVATLVNAALWWYPSQGHRLVHPDLSPRVIRRHHILTLTGPVILLLLMVLVAVGVGRLINPLLLCYLVALGYIAVEVFEWWNPREVGPDTVGEAKPEVSPAEEGREGDDLTSG